MLSRGLTASFLSLLLIACSDGTGNEAQNLSDVGDNETAPSAPGGEPGDGADNAGNGATPPPGAPAPPPPDNGTQDPEPSGEVTLSAAPARTSAGATMTLTLRNGSRESVGYNLCTSAIETRAGRPVRTDRVCTLELRTLAPGRTTNYPYELPDGLADGTYRFLTQVEWMESGRRSGIRSNRFEVR